MPVKTTKANDLMRFGPSPRPALDGVFNNDDSLIGIAPKNQLSVSRKVSGSSFVDTDHESDWSLKPGTPGSPTGP